MTTPVTESISSDGDTTETTRSVSADAAIIGGTASSSPPLPVPVTVRPAPPPAAMDAPLHTAVRALVQKYWEPLPAVYDDRVVWAERRIYLVQALITVFLAALVAATCGMLGQWFENPRATAEQRTLTWVATVGLPVLLVPALGLALSAFISPWAMCRWARHELASRFADIVSRRTLSHAMVLDPHRARAWYLLQRHIFMYHNNKLDDERDGYWEKRTPHERILLRTRVPDLKQLDAKMRTSLAMLDLKDTSAAAIEKALCLLYPVTEFTAPNYDEPFQSAV